MELVPKNTSPKERQISPDPKLFRPADALVFRSLPAQFAIIREMRERYDGFKHLGYSSKSAFYYAFVLSNANKHGISTDLGAEAFQKELITLLGVAQDIVEYMIDQRFRPFRERIAFHNTIANCLDPIKMLLMATDDPGSHADRLDRRRHFEAGRQLGIALQLFSISSVDPEAWVPEDLAQIEQLSWERLFDVGASETLWVLATLHQDPSMGGRTKDVRVFTSTKEKTHVLKRMRRRGMSVQENQLSCRVAFVKGMRYYIYAINRRKRLLSTLMKLERGRPYSDRRGWKYVVVAVETPQGLRTATPEDAKRFSEHTRQFLWNYPLVEEVDESAPNPDSDSRYRDEKIIGRFERPDNGRIIAGPAEQMVTSIGPHIDTLVATDGQLNHTIYSARKALKYLAHLWFPYRRGPYSEIPDFRLPGYGVAWDKPYFRDQLEAWWHTQL